MSELISGKVALNNWYDNVDTEIQFLGNIEWYDINNSEVTLEDFKDRGNKFRLKPRTITINGIEVPAPFEPCAEDDCRAYVIDTRSVNGYDWQHSSHCNHNHIVWRTEEEIKQVVSALRSVFKGGVI